MRSSSQANRLLIVLVLAEFCCKSQHAAEASRALEQTLETKKVEVWAPGFRGNLLNSRSCGERRGVQFKASSEPGT